MTRTRRPAAVVAAIAVLAAIVALDARQANPPGEWRHYHGDLGATRYSPLDLITRENVASLRLQWRFRLENFGSPPEYRNQAAPLYANGTLYMPAGINRDVVAIEPATGRLKWMWTLDEGDRGRRAPRRNSGRGVAYWTDGRDDERIIVVTPGFQLVALDARTGRPIQTFGDGGIVDMKRDMGRDPDDPRAPIGNSSPAVIVNGVIVVGPALELGFRPPTMKNVAGFVRGFDVRTGRPLWRFHTIPQGGEPYAETWENESWRYTGNAGVWAPFSADEELGYVYLPVEAGTGDLYGGHRLGDNVYSSSLVCLDARTGKVVWHYQLIRHDIWDYDNTTAPMLIDVNVEGRAIKMVALFTKQSFTYVFDRVTGEPIWPIEDRPVPQSTAATQSALAKSDQSDMDWVQGPAVVPTVQGLPIVKPPYGRITAIDLRTGTIAWQRVNGDTPWHMKNHPLLAGLDLPPMGSRSRAGLLATKTLLFAGEGAGGLPYFRALDKATGDILWEIEIPGVQIGLPMTYLHEGRQYVAFTVGDQERDVPAELIAFALAR